MGRGIDEWPLSCYPFAMEHTKQKAATPIGGAIKEESLRMEHTNEQAASLMNDVCKEESTQIEHTNERATPLMDGERKEESAQMEHINEKAAPLFIRPLHTGGRISIYEKDAAKGDAAPEDVVVLDDRATGNPSFQILASYRIRSRARKKEILQAIIDFDMANPTDPQWKRSMDSLVREWNLHNLAYRLHVYRRSSRDVDLDNRDEGKGYVHFFIVAAQRVWERLTRR